MPKVYRVELPDGTGPYQWESANKKGIVNMLGDDKLWPIFDFAHLESIELKELEAYKFACPDLNTLLEWFGDVLEDLQQYGFDVKEIEAKEIILSKSGKQCIFK